MKVLFITCEMPRFTRGGGGNLRQYHLVKGVAQRHEVSVVTAVLPWELGYVDELASVCETVRVVPQKVQLHAKHLPRWRSWQQRLRFAAHPRPYEVQQYHQLLGGMRNHVMELARTTRFDIIQVEHSNIAYWMETLRLPGFRILDVHNILSEWVLRDVQYEAIGRRRLLRWLDWRKTLRYESWALSRFHHLLAVSERDRIRLTAQVAGLPVTLVPNSVDTQHIRPIPAEPIEGEIVLSGSMNHPPNVDSAVYFCREILPMVRREMPSAHLSIVGRYPTHQVLELGREAGITVTGEVEDIRPYLSRAAVAVVPMRQGAGTRIKVLDALAAGKAIVSTSVGVEGIDVTDDIDAMIADDPRSFAEHTVRLLRDAELRRGLGRAGRELAVKHYDWRVAVEALESVYDLAGSAASSS